MCDIVFTWKLTYQIYTDYHTILPYESTNINIAMGSSLCNLKGDIWSNATFFVNWVYTLMITEIS